MRYEIIHNTLVVFGLYASCPSIGVAIGALGARAPLGAYSVSQNCAKNAAKHAIFTQ